MARQNINIGARGNDGSGDTIREAFKKINLNFDELYAAVGNRTGSFTSTASIISGTTLTIGGTVGGKVEVGQVITGTGVISGTTIIGLGTGRGGAGTYIIDTLHNPPIASTSIRTATNGYQSLKSASLADFPSNYYGDQVLITNNDGSRFVTKTLHAGPGIDIDLTTSDQLTISSTIGATITTDQVLEGASELRKYCTDIRVRSFIKGSSDGKILFNSATGEISTNLVGFTNAAARGAFSAGNGINIDSNGVISSALIGSTGINIVGNYISISPAFVGYTDALARNAISVTDHGNDGALSYDSSTGTINYYGPSPAEVRSHFSAGTGLSYDSVNGVYSSTQTSFTDALARDAIVVVDAGGFGSLTYTHDTNFPNKGRITYTGPSAAEVRSNFSAGLGLTYTESTGQYKMNLDASVSPEASKLVSRGTSGEINAVTFHGKYFHEILDLSSNSTNPLTLSTYGAPLQTIISDGSGLARTIELPDPALHVGVSLMIVNRSAVNIITLHTFTNAFFANISPLYGLHIVSDGYNWYQL